MKSLFSFGPAADVAFVFDGADGRPKAGDLQIFTTDENVSGTVSIVAKKLEHVGIKIELLGVIEMTNDKGYPFEFTSSVRDLAPAGTIEDSQDFGFSFANVDKPHESYHGKTVKLRYFVRLTIARSYATNITREQDFLVHVLGTAPEINSTIKMEVGIEDCLHIEFEYDKSKYHLKDVVVGKVFFLLVRIKIKHMELAIVRRESSGGGSDKANDSETITKFEIMDGAPVKGESIPVRLYLGGMQLTPSHKNISNKFSVKYFLNLVLVDDEDRRYFKQQEITLWRSTIGS
ncbi:vacuolar protein sorting-associated protein 26B-B [Achlya hypogyna]|uniref:Vacuolar protein sorting-associated protein 26B-B n=1 Tax=Achlya hypogyna TaxID=1202772 RepID=A0A1V9YLE0_ACHHY|nr:vacuolar protein sorting-associated protein 26B-B [Achlya hypogyna]